MAEITDQGKLNFYKANGYFLGSINGNKGDLTGLGNDTSYYNNDLYVQWETKDANKKPMDKTEHKSLGKLEVKSLNINGKEFDDFIKNQLMKKLINH